MKSATQSRYFGEYTFYRTESYDVLPLRIDQEKLVYVYTESDFDGYSNSQICQSGSETSC